MNINENQTYYKLVFPRHSNNQRISLLEKKKLTCHEYYKQEHGEFVPIVIFKEKTDYLQESPLLPRQSYTIYEKQSTNESFFAINRYWSDDFFYDEEKEIIFYGSTCIYLEKKDGRFYDITTGIEVPAHSFFTVRELVSKNDIKKMEQHLNLVERHKQLYCDTIAAIFEKYEQEYLNYRIAQEKYRKDLEVFLENPCFCQEEDLSLQAEKVKSKIYEIDW